MTAPKSLESFPLIRSIEDLNGAGYWATDESVYVVSGSVLAQVSRRWQLCRALADLLHKLEIGRVEDLS